MPASQPESNPDAVSEVVGQILIFGILSTVLILSLLSFAAAKDGAEERVVAVRADSVAQRVAGEVVQAALFAESTRADQLTLRSALDLPFDLEGRGYSIDLEPDAVIVRAAPAVAQAPLFASAAPAGVHVCDQDPIGGGPLDVVVTSIPAGGPLPAGVTCPDLGPDVTRIITLEIA